MSVVIHGHGPAPAQGSVPLVLLHGFPLDRRMWDGVIEHLDGVPIYAVDLPGFGAAADAAEPTGATLESFADALAQALHERGVQQAVIAGLSMGGYVLLAFIERHPQLLAGVGLLDTKASADTVEARAARLAVARNALDEAGSGAVAAMIESLVGPATVSTRPAVVEQLRSWLADAPPPGIAAAQRAMAVRPDRLEVLRALDVPALVLRGEQDSLSGPEEHEAMAALLNTEVVTVPDVGHMSAVEDAASVAEALADLHRRASAQ